MKRVRVLTISDMHQLRSLYDQIARAVDDHRPDVLCLIGDFLEALRCGPEHMSCSEAATRLAALSVEHIMVVRGNHEDANWLEFARAWPASRQLIQLHGTAHTIGPLVVLGFPCHTGFDGYFRRTLTEDGNYMTFDLAASGRKRLPQRTGAWLDGLMERLGEPGRTLWLSHEPPMTEPIARAELRNTEWASAVAKYRPMFTVSGHDHSTPLRWGRWNGCLGTTYCVNTGQSRTALHYALLDFLFESDAPSRPIGVQTQAFGQDLEAGD